MEWVRNVVGSVSDTKFVHEGVEFGVQNAVTLIVEYVYFQKCSEGLHHHTSVYQKEARFVGGWISFADNGIM